MQHHLSHMDVTKYGRKTPSQMVKNVPQKKHFFRVTFPYIPQMNRKRFSFKMACIADGNEGNWMCFSSHIGGHIYSFFAHCKTSGTFKLSLTTHVKGYGRETCRLSKKGRCRLMNSELYYLSHQCYRRRTPLETFKFSTTSTHQTNVVVAKKVLGQEKKRHSEQKPSSGKTCGETCTQTGAESSRKSSRKGASCFGYRKR